MHAAVALSSAFAAHSRVYLHSVSDVSLLSVDALDSLLSSESFMVDSEDALLQILLYAWTSTPSSPHPVGICEHCSNRLSL
jgi:hypothetical protein